MVGLGNRQRRADRVVPCVTKLYVGTQRLDHAPRFNVVGQQLGSKPSNVSLPSSLDQALQQHPAKPFAMIPIDDRHSQLRRVRLIIESDEPGAPDSFGLGD